MLFVINPIFVSILKRNTKTSEYYYQKRYKYYDYLSQLLNFFLRDIIDPICLKELAPSRSTLSVLKNNQLDIPTPAEKKIILANFKATRRPSHSVKTLTACP